MPHYKREHIHSFNAGIKPTYHISSLNHFQRGLSHTLNFPSYWLGWLSFVREPNHTQIFVRPRGFANHQYYWWEVLVLERLTLTCALPHYVHWPGEISIGYKEGRYIELDGQLYRAALSYIPTGVGPSLCCSNSYLAIEHTLISRL